MVTKGIITITTIITITITNTPNSRRYLATTHFEPTYARSAFPCFDEPQFKARFRVSIFRDRFHIALCNMPITNTEDAGFYMGRGLVSTQKPFTSKSASCSTKDHPGQSYLRLWRPSP